MTREEKLNKSLKYWQIFLNLQSWNLSIQQVDFSRKDWPQSGDIEVDQDTKTAIVKITKEDTGIDHSIILHELLHLILWKYDHFNEKFIPEDKKEEYFDLLESTVANIQRALIQADK